jgi:hypothetical protein
MPSAKIIQKRDKSLENTPENRLTALTKAKDNALRVLEEHDFDEELGSKNLFILDNVLCPIGFFRDRIQRKFEIEDFIDVWQLFCYICREINKKTVFTPTVNTFCNFMNISSATFNSILLEKSERGEMCRFIKDTLADRLMQAMLEEKVPAIPSIFIAKANFGMRDNDAPVTNIVVQEQHMSAQEILNEFKKG